VFRKNNDRRSTAPPKLKNLKYRGCRSSRLAKGAAQLLLHLNALSRRCGTEIPPRGAVPPAQAALRRELREAKAAFHQLKAIDAGARRGRR
jgi:hypothetical protein